MTSFPTQPEATAVLSSPALVRLAAAARLVACFAVLPIMRHAGALEALVLPLPFAAYGGWLYWRAVARPGAEDLRFVYWLDGLWFLALTLTTGGPSSPFALFLLFPILFVSFRNGFASGMTMAVAAALLLPLPALLKGDGTPSALIPPATLLVLGYLIAGRAASSLELHRRLSLLRGLTAEFDPRLTPEQWVDLAVERIGRRYGIERYLLLLDGGRLLEATFPGPLKRVPDALALELCPRLARLEPPWLWHRRRARKCGLAARLLSAQRGAADDLGELLQCRALCAVSIPLRGGASARLFLAACNRFTADDLLFFQQMAQQLGPRMANASLLDQLAGQVAEYERQKISRDLHDSAVQPYLGLKFALEALQRKVSAQDPLASDLAKLVDMTTVEIAELRRYVKGLRRAGEPGNAALVPALKRQAERFAELYGIRVTVSAPEGLRISDDLADHAFHMIGEALSNVRRHTRAGRARVELACDNGRFSIRVANPADDDRPPGFVPRSITERASSLGGVCRVEQGSNGETEVVVALNIAA